MRKRFLTIATLIAASCVLQPRVVAQDGQGNVKLPVPLVAAGSNTIHQEVDFDASPGQLYEALLDARQFTAFAAQSGGFSAHSASIDRSVG